MFLSRYLPIPLVNSIKQILARQRYPHSTIHTPYVERSAKLGRGARLNPNVHVSGRVIIGDYTYVNQGTFIGSGTIGKFCSIGYYCLIGLPEHPLDRVSTSPYTYGPASVIGVANDWSDISSPPIIENDVWLGSHVTVLQGVRIGNGAVVGAGAVVTQDIPPYAIAVGVPARVIRYRFDDATVERLLSLRWWDWNDAERRQYARLFQEGPESVARLSMGG